METIFQIKQSDLHDLVNELKAHITKEIKSIHHNNNSDHLTEQPITPKQAAAYLKIGLSTYYHKIKRGEIPISVLHRSGKKVWLFKSELTQYCKQS